MKSFVTNKDGNKQTWDVEVNVGAIKRIRDLIGVDLMRILEGDLLEQLRLDPVQLVDVIYVLCKPQADERKISDEDFGRAMTGESLDGAIAALFGELADFFPSPTRQILQATLKRIEKLARVAVSEIKNLPTDKELQKALRILMAKRAKSAGIAAAAGKGSSSSRAASVSRRGRSRGASSSK